jgi:molecular chaperone GrpE
MVENEKENEENSEKAETTSKEEGLEAPSHKLKIVQISDEELKGMQKELVEYKDKYLRLLADAENSRKRLQKEKQEISRYAIEGLIADFLHPLDNLENALKFAQDMSEEVKNWAYGFQMILTQFKDVLAQNGVFPIESLGKQFNPHDHEAVEMIETKEEPPGTIIEECVRGYRMGDRTIRAARVKVAKQ